MALQCTIIAINLHSKKITVYTASNDANPIKSKHY